MAFVCPPKCESEKRTQLLSDLKNLINCIEDKLVPTAEPTYCITPCMPACMPCCPPCCPSKQEEEVCEVPETMICYKVSCNNNTSGKAKSKTNGGETINRVKKSTSRELRASVLYVGCHCEKRDGLQDDCQRSDCQGSPQCLTKPPTCGPSEYCDGKHLGAKFATSGRNEQKDTNGVDGIDSTEVNYVCFPAKMNPPKMCVPTCFVPIECCPCCPNNDNGAEN